MKHKHTITVPTANAEIHVPARWAICYVCEGEGTQSDCGEGITASEWGEYHDEEREAYLAGVYDQACPHCEGSCKVLEVDEAACMPAELAAVQAWYDDMDALAREIADERRLGC